MKARPRSVEREVAEALSEFYNSKGWPSVSRIPVLGREGPDIDVIPECPLVIDVKSRLEVPKAALLSPGEFAAFIPFGESRTGAFDAESSLLGVRLDEIEKFFDRGFSPNCTRPATKTVANYWQHLDAWRQEFCPRGVTAIIVHRPRRPIRACTIIIHSNERSKLWQDATLKT